MENEIIVALMAFGGTLIGSVISSKLTNYRIEQLEKKVDKHNSVIERTFILETQMKECKTDIKDLEKAR